MYIGSGDVSSLLAGKDTESFKGLLRRFVSGEKPYYNALASPIDALRTGAILEDRYLEILPEGYYAQYRVISNEMDVFRASLDFARLDGGKVVDFDELKTCSLDDFLKLRDLGDHYVDLIRKSYKKYYNQIQEQLYCSGLDEAGLVFLVAYSYVDEENRAREIRENEYVRFGICRDETVISQIKERGRIFQQIKDFFK
jgi:hypothetical protein